MGPMTRNEWLMLATVVLLLNYGYLVIDPTTASFTSLSVLLLAGVLTWEDVKKEKDA